MALLPLNPNGPLVRRTSTPSTTEMLEPFLRSGRLVPAGLACRFLDASQAEIGWTRQSARAHQSDEGASGAKARLHTYSQRQMTAYWAVLKPLLEEFVSVSSDHERRRMTTEDLSLGLTRTFRIAETAWRERLPESVPSQYQALAHDRTRSPLATATTGTHWENHFLGGAETALRTYWHAALHVPELLERYRETSGQSRGTFWARARFDEPFSLDRFVVAHYVASAHIVVVSDLENLFRHTDLFADASGALRLGFQARALEACRLIMHDPEETPQQDARFGCPSLHAVDPTFKTVANGVRYYIERLARTALWPVEQRRLAR